MGVVGERLMGPETTTSTTTTFGYSILNSLLEHKLYDQTMTENHNLNEPEEGTLDWNVPLNDNFRRIDTAVEIRDTEDSLDNYTPKDGAKFLATDTGVRYLGDGSQWVEAPPQPLDMLAIPSVQSDPSDAVNGEFWYREDTGEIKAQLEANVVSLASGEPVTDDTQNRSDNSHTHTLEVWGTGSPSHYDLTVSGDLKAESATFEPRDGEFIDGSRAVGWVTETNHVDRFSFTGEVTEFDYQSDSEGPVTLVIDSEEYTDSEIVGQPSG